MKIPLLKIPLDERFLDYRRRSTSVAGITGGAVAILLFEYRLFVDHVWSWDLLAVALTIVGVKLAVMAWHFWRR
jgi:hypothetical protein